MEHDPYSYNMLPEGVPAIRLLRLKASTGHNIECELLETVLDDQIMSYEAVSYTWGKKRSADLLYINGRTLFITQNLSLILRDLRHADKDRILWIDAICINQTDSTEKSHQVQQMKRVYQRAHRVLFCISRPTEMSDFWMTCLREFDDRCAVVKPGSQHDRAKLWQIMQAEWEEEHYMVVSRQRQGLGHVLRQPWFYRVWILQEVANARDALVYCGRMSVSAGTFGVAPELAGITIKGHCRSVLDLMPGPARKFSMENSTLESLLKEFRFTKAKEQHDKVYALLGLCEEAEGARVIIDYSSPVEDVIRMVIAHIRSANMHGLSGIKYSSVDAFFADLDKLDNILYWHYMSKNDPFGGFSHLTRFGKAAGVNTPRGVKQTFPIHAAAKRGDSAIVSALLANCADTTRRDWRGHVALSLCAQRGHITTVRMLLATARIDEINSQCQAGSSPLSLAAENGHHGVVSLLLAVPNIGINLQRNDGLSPLHLAAENGHHKVVKLLLAAPNININLEDSVGRSPLFLAAQQDHAGVVSLLLAAPSIDVNIKARNGTPLSLSAREGNARMVKLLLAAHDTDVNRPGRRGSPLQEACEAGHSTIVRLLLASGRINVNQVSGAGDTALFAAITSYKESIVEMLLKTNGVDVNFQARNGMTPLCYTAKRQFEPGVRLLLSTCQVRVDIQDKKGMTALDYAKAGNDKVLEDLLLSYSSSN